MKRKRYLRSRTGIALGFITLVILGNSGVAEEENTADYWMEIAYGLTANGSYEDAVLAYDRVLDIDPNNYTALINKGHALQYWALNSYNQALEITNEILEGDPDDALAWQGKGAALSGLNRQGEDDLAYSRAIEVLNRTLESDPSDGEAWFLKGENYVNMHNAEAALAAYEEVIELNYTQRTNAAWIMKAILLAELQRFDEALSASEMAVDLSPDSPSAWMINGYVLEKLGRNNEAILAYARANGGG